MEIKRPRNLAKRKPSQFAFVVYDNPESVKEAIAQMHGKGIWDTEITVGDGDFQDSYFTQDTGRTFDALL